jgi:hypothetical protein
VRDFCAIYSPLPSDKLDVFHRLKVALDRLLTHMQAMEPSVAGELDNITALRMVTCMREAQVARLAAGVQDARASCN